MNIAVLIFFIAVVFFIVRAHKRAEMDRAARDFLGESRNELDKLTLDETNVVIKRLKKYNTENIGDNIICPQCHSFLILRIYRGYFLGCSRYPECRYRQSYEGME